MQRTVHDLGNALTIDEVKVCGTGGEFFFCTAHSMMGVKNIEATPCRNPGRANQPEGTVKVTHGALEETVHVTPDSTAGATGVLWGTPG